MTYYVPRVVYLFFAFLNQPLLIIIIIYCKQITGGSVKNFCQGSGKQSLGSTGLRNIQVVGISLCLNVKIIIIIITYGQYFAHVLRKSIIRISVKVTQRVFFFP